MSLTLHGFYARLPYLEACIGSDAASTVSSRRHTASNPPSVRARRIEGTKLLAKR